MKQLVKQRNSGQSLPLIALMIVVLFAFVALSVDVGNTYAQQRATVRATNAAALAALDGVIKGYSDESIAKIIRESLKSNGIVLDDNSATDANGDPIQTTQDGRTVRAYYMDVDGRPIGACQIGVCATVPSQVNYVQVSVNGEVQTYFARVVGQDKLGVRADAYAYRCPPTNGVYPIAVNASDIDVNANEFKQPASPTKLNTGTYYDDVYKSGKRWRRLGIEGTTATMVSNFSFVRWNQNAWSQANLVSALTDDGTLANGFTEMPTWPSGKSGAVSNYPLAPNQINAQDWVYAEPTLYWGANDSLRAALVAQMQNHTIMVLPIIDDTYGSTSPAAAFKLSRLGKFMIVDTSSVTGPDSGVSKSTGTNNFLDLVYLGPATEKPCLVTDLDPIKDTTTTVQPITVTIPFRVRPQYTDESIPSQPIAYQLVVDVSGSMSWDFRGNGTVSGKDYRCEYSSKDTTYKYYDSCSGGINSPWRVTSERRIYLTKKAIEGFINDMRPGDVMRYTSFSTRSDYSGNTKVVPSSGYTDDKNVLLSALPSIGAYNNDPYRTEGGTPGAQALAKAKDIILQAPAQYMGKPYKPVVIYLTDGVANVFLDGKTNSTCPDHTATAAVNDPVCQIGKTSNGTLKPISAMIDQADKLKAAGKDRDVQLYVLALAGVATEGLSNVASPGKLYTAEQGFQVQQVLDAIRGDAVGATCIEKEVTVIDRIDSSHHTDGSGAWTLAADSYGKATVWNENGTAIVKTVDITHITDPNSSGFGGNLGIKLDLAPGKYQLAAWIGYKGDDKPSRVNRYYDWLDEADHTFTSPSQRYSFTVGQNDGLNYAVEFGDIDVGLKPGTAVCP